jgi:hypothetical protein
MDDARFDTLIRSFGMTYSRRGFSRLLGGVTAGGLLTALEATEAAGSRPGGAPCKRGRQCLTRQCVGPKGQKQCTCSQKFPFCLEPRNPCQEATCDTVSQQCATTNKPDNDSCGDNLNCSGGVCGEELGCGGPANCAALPFPAVVARSRAIRTWQAAFATTVSRGSPATTPTTTNVAKARRELRWRVSASTAVAVGARTSPAMRTVGTAAAGSPAWAASVGS